MKRLIISFITLIFLVSCSKDHACSCSGDSTSETFFIDEDKSPNEAFSECDSYELNYSDNTTCALRY